MTDKTSLRPVYNGRALWTDEGNTVKRKENVTVITETACKTFTPTFLQFHNQHSASLAFT